MIFIIHALEKQRMIRMKSCWARVLPILAAILLSSQAFGAQEDTAQLTFSKTVPAKNKSLQNAYTVQQGEVLSAIIRRIPGITEKDIPRYYRMTKELNPEITDLDKLYAGQTIFLPGKGLSGAKEISPSRPGGGQTYQVKKGDSLLRIIYREMRITSGAWKTLKLVQSLNPRIVDVNKIYEGQTIRLPGGETAAIVSAKVAAEESTRAEVSQEESPLQEVAKAEAKDSIALSPAKRLAVIKHIILQMKGNMITSGNYYLPVSDTEQLTIDCSMIPVVELDSRTTIFLDLGSRSSNHLKKIINDRWKNYHLVKILDKDDVIVTLKKIFKIAAAYDISKAQRPVSAGSAPPVEVLFDWIITKKEIKTSSRNIQGLRLIDQNDTLLPRAIVSYARQNSLTITEISPEKGIVEKPQELYSLPPVTTLPVSSARDFCLALLAYLNVQGEKDADVSVFNIEKDGFNLSIKADMAVTQGDKKTLIFSRSLPEQFTEILQKAGNKLIFISDEDAPAKNMEKILQGFNFVFTSGYFSFSGLDKNQPPYHFGFNGTKIKTDKNIYVVNFDFNRELRGLMHETWQVDIVRY